MLDLLGFADFQVDMSPEPEDGPIGWPGYGETVRAAVSRSGSSESVRVGAAHIGGVDAVVIAFEFKFLGGSLGRRTGDRIEFAFQRARELGVPVVSLVATGGSRMQQGMRALTQLQRVAREVALTRAAGIPQVSVLLDPTIGGGWATLGAGADVVLAVPGAQVGFGGSRVRPADAPPEAYTAEAKLAWGQVDQIVPPAELPEVLGRWLQLLSSPGAAAEPPAALGSGELPLSGWDAVQAARSAKRPRAGAYLDAYFGWREEICGDRAGGVDEGVLCGFGWRGRAIAYAAQCGTATTPAGFRPAARLVRLADRLGIPVLTLVDTPGAANDAAAERDGAGPAIASLFEAVAQARVPITSLVIGEGGSGGALAFAAPGSTWITPDAYFSVTSPEAAAAILKLDPAEASTIASQLRLRPQDLVELGIARAVVSRRP